MKWRLVPVVPTPEMCIRGALSEGGDDPMESAWFAMLDAAPAPDDAVVERMLVGFYGEAWRTASEKAKQNDRARMLSALSALENRCPFGDPRYSLDIDTPCPVCGELGVPESEVKCVDFANRQASGESDQ